MHFRLPFWETVKIQAGCLSPRFYDRLFTPAVTLWCMVFQRLNHDHTLQAAVADLHAGGADLLADGAGKPPAL